MDHSNRLVLESVVANSPMAYCLTDQTGRIRFVNEAFVGLYGYKPDEVLGRTPRFLNPGQAAYFANGVYYGEYERLFYGMKLFLSRADGSSWTGRLLNKTKSGDLVWVRMTITHLSKNGKPTGGFLSTSESIVEELDADLHVRMEIYNAITSLAETRDSETGEHLRRIARYSASLAEGLGMPAEFTRRIELFSPLHDIGKVGIPDQILLAPRSLTAEEFALMKTHTDLGYQILVGKQSLEMAAEIARYHHERYDGTGYPLGLAGGAIPIAARITAVADVYDALTSDRPYKPAWSHGDAVELIREERGRQFDPNVVDAFETVAEEFVAMKESPIDVQGER